MLWSGLWGIGALLLFGSWFLMFWVGGPMIRWLRDKRWRKEVQTQTETWQVREDTPETHQKKQGTPSMGGIGIIGVACAMFVAVTGILILANSNGRSFWIDFWPEMTGIFLLPVVVAAHAVLGFTDDWSKASGRGGLRARAKLFGQVGISVFFLAALVLVVSTRPTRPGQGFLSLTSYDSFGGFPGILTLLLLLLVGTCNAVNLTDGIDGLAAGLAVQAGIAAWLVMPGDGETQVCMLLFWAALAGSCLGFLAFNKYPAKVFMGDTGSLALGNNFVGMRQRVLERLAGDPFEICEFCFAFPVFFPHRTVEESCFRQSEGTARRSTQWGHGVR